MAKQTILKVADLNVADSVTPSVEVPYVSKSMKEIAAKKLEEFMKEETRLVKGLFQHFECPGASQKITYKKYPTPADMRKRGGSGGVEPFSKVMVDGGEYEIPLYVARFLNGTDVTASALGDEKVSSNIGSCSYGVSGFKMSGDQLPPSQLGMGPDNLGGIPVPIVGVTKRVKRYGFQSLEFAAGVA